MSDVLLEVNKLEKFYSKKLFSRKSSNSKRVLGGVSFSVKRGECLGVLGRNGAGKSTLLKILNGSIGYDSGQVIKRGKVASIIEINSNLEPGLTGQENVSAFYKLKGYLGSELKSKITKAIEFSEIKDEINDPVSKYSSGMKAKLAFSMAINLDFEILLVDEVLAVGDFIFQQKCHSYFNAIRRRAAILLVSHSVNLLKQFCDCGLVIENGISVFNGGIEDAVSQYMSRIGMTQKKHNLDSELLMFGESFDNKNKIQCVDVKINKSSFKVFEKLSISLKFELSFDPNNLIVGIPIWDDQGRLVTAVNSDFPLDSIHMKGRTYKSTISVMCNLNPGKYHAVLAIVDGPEYLYRLPAFSFEVVSTPRVFGFFTPEAEWIYE